MNITDEMLFRAAPEAAERWLSALPEREDCGHDFSLTFEAAMEPLLRRRRRRWKTLALLAAVLAALTGLLALGVSAGRPDDYRVYVAQEEGYVAYRAVPKEGGSTQDFHQLTPQWVPEGFVQTDADLRKSSGSLRYCRGEGPEFLYFTQQQGVEYTGTMMGSYHLENVRVNGEEAVFFSDLDSSSAYLLWTQGPNVLFVSSGGLEKTDLIRFAENLN